MKLRGKIVSIMIIAIFVAITAGIIISGFIFMRERDEINIINSALNEGANKVDLSEMVEQFGDGYIELFLAFTLVNILQIIAIVHIIRKMVVNPINKLTDATKRISEGDLEFEINKTRNDEIGDLEEGFDNMRRHLKDSTEKNMKNAESARDAMSNISHDLKTPLTAIKGYSEGILDGVADTDEKKRKYVKTIYSKACAMEELVEDLSYFSKLDNSGISYSFRLIPIKEFIIDCLDDVSMDMETKGFKLIEDFDESCENVQAIIDPDEIRRVVLNIVGNSMKYMDKSEGKEIRVSLKCEEAHALISISDNGRGIEEEDLPRIFDRFYRADSSRGTRTGGTGLGLAIAKSIIEDHGGEISVTSKVGKETTISFTVPTKSRKE